MSGVELDRRGLLAAGAMAALASGARAALPPPRDFDRVPIWPGAAPGAPHVPPPEQEVRRRADGPAEDTAITHVAQPTLTHIRPAKPNGAALLMIPGGGYVRVAVGIEGYAIARRFAEAGYHCFVLVYRLPADGWAAGPDAPLQDAQRAMRLIRARAAREGFDAKRVGAIGFSAGGHLAARLATVREPTYAAVDAADAAPFLPQVAGLLYPVIQMAGPFTHKGSRDQMFGPSADPAKFAAYSVEQHVLPGTPPTFLAAAADDKVVPVENSLGMFSALKSAGVPSEMHIFETGGHGFGLKRPDGSASPWPDLFLHWAGTHGV